MRYEARALPATLLGPIVALSVAPAIVVLARGGEQLGQAVVAALVIGGGAAALAALDPAAAILGGVPVPLVRRWAFRLGVIAACTAMVWTAVLVPVLWRDHRALADLGDRIGELAVVAGLSAAAGASADRRGQSVTSAALIGPIAVLVVSSLAQRYPALPTIGGRGDGATWATLAAAAWASALWERRDPYGFAARRRDR
jgi:hypothetical protein